MGTGEPDNHLLVLVTQASETWVSTPFSLLPSPQLGCLATPMPDQQLFLVQQEWRHNTISVYWVVLCHIQGP